MKPITSYLQSAAQRGERFSNASGYRNGAGQFQGMPAKGGFQYAGGANASIGDTPVSAPYIINVTATSSVALGSQVNLFFANNYLNSPVASTTPTAPPVPTWYNGSLYLQGSGAAGLIIISSGFSNSSYQQLLQQSTTKPFQIGKTLYVSTSGQLTSQQVTSPITYSEQYANGSQATKPLIFVYDISQQITTQTVNKEIYSIDGNTSLQISIQTSGVANSFSLYIYPTIEVNTSAALTGNTVVNSYSAPTSPLSAVMIR